MLSKMNIEKPWKLFNQNTRQSTILRIMNTYLTIFLDEEPANERHVLSLQAAVAIFFKMQIEKP